MEMAELALKLMQEQSTATKDTRVSIDAGLWIKGLLLVVVGSLIDVDNPDIKKPSSEPQKSLNRVNLCCGNGLQLRAVLRPRVRLGTEARQSKI